MSYTGIVYCVSLFGIRLFVEKLPSHPEYAKTAPGDKATNKKVYNTFNKNPLIPEHLEKRQTKTDKEYHSERSESKGMAYCVKNCVLV